VHSWADCDGDTCWIEVDKSAGATREHTARCRPACLGPRLKLLAVSGCGGCLSGYWRLVIPTAARNEGPWPPCGGRAAPAAVVTSVYTARGCRCLACNLGCAPTSGVCKGTNRYVGGRPAVCWSPRSLTARHQDRVCSGSMAGGYIVGNQRWRLLERGRLARDLGVVWSRRLPAGAEHPFPAALDDCMATLRWMRSNADEWASIRKKTASP